MKKGLVLEGGALRGLFTAGVMDVMMENGIDFDGVIGVSAGAAFGCNYKSRQPGRVIRYNKRYAHDWRYCSLRSLLKTGDIFGAEFDYHTLPDKLDKFDVSTFDSNPMEFYAVCTDLVTGEPVYKLLMHHGYEFNEWIRASASMPLASRIVDVEGRKLLDGGISDSIPLRFFEQQGFDRNVVVLTRPKGFVKKPNLLMPLIRLQLHRYPKFLKAAAERHLMYNAETEYVLQQEKAGRVFVIRPESILPIKHITHDTDLMQKVYEDGRSAIQLRLNELKAFLSSPDPKLH
jgi:predicted patatin/cPLA2 family phospholipase